MATADSIPENGANSRQIGTTLVVHGQVQAQAADNSTRLLQAGSPIFLHERIITGEEGMISILFGDAARTQLDLGRMSDVVLNEDVFEGDPADFGEATAEVEQIQQALLAGTFDPTTDLEPAAAGPTAAGPISDGGGSSYVEFSLTGEAVTPASGAETIGVGLGFLDPPQPELQQPVEPAPEPEPFITETAPAPPPTPTPTPTSTVAAGTSPPADPPIIPPTPPPPANSSPSAGDYSSFVEERGLSDGTDGTNPSLTTTTGTLSQLGIDFGGDGPGSLTFGHGSTTVTVVLDGSPSTATPLSGTYGTLTIFGDGTWKYEITDNTSDHSGTNLVGAADTVPDNFTFTVFDSNGDSANGTLAIAIYDDGPAAVIEAEGFTASVEEDDLPGGINEDASSGHDEASGPAGSLAPFFTVGADDPGTYGITEDSGILAGLPSLFSKGEAVSYSSDGTTLTATAGGREVFTLTVNEDGSWAFDQKDQLDHVDDGANDENFALNTNGGPVNGIDFSSILTVTDFDGDTVTGAAEGSFLIAVQDDVPDIGTPQDSILVLEVGNSLTASLDLIGSGADEPCTVRIALTEGDPVTTTALSGGKQMTNDGKPLFWHQNDDASWSAVTESSPGVLDVNAKSFTVSVDETSGTYTVVQNGALDGGATTIHIGFAQSLNGGNEDEAVFGSSGVFLLAKGSTDQNTFDFHDGTAKVNYSNQGIGVDVPGGDTGAMVEGTGGSDGSARTSEILSLKFYSNIVYDHDEPHGTVDEGYSTRLEVSSASIRIDHLGTEETAYYTLWRDGVQVSSQLSVTNTTGGAGGTSSPSDDLTVHIDSSDLNAGETVFDEIRFEAGGILDKHGEQTEGDYRIVAVDLAVYHEGYDQTIEVPFEITDADGDTVSDDFSITFDGNGIIDAASADSLDGDVSTNGMVIAGSSNSEEMSGTNYNDTIDGGGGDDQIDGNAGDDSIEGGTGDDILVGNIGDDTIYGKEDSDQLEGNAGKDQLVGGEGSDTLDGGDADDVVVGDDVDFSTPLDPVIVEDDAPDTIDGGAGIDTAGDRPETAPANNDTITAESTLPDLDSLVAPPDDEA